MILGSSVPALAQQPAVQDGAVTLPAVVISGQGGLEGEGQARDGYRAGTGELGVLGRLPLKEIPFSINVAPNELIENTNAHSLADALKTNPTATLLMSSAGYSSMTRMMVRGFTAADQSEMRDGLVDRSFSYPPIENVERIEVMNGFSGFLYGFSALGGSVNYVSKRPTAEPLHSLRIGDYGGGITYVHGDAGGPVPGTDGRLGYRLNAYHEDGDTYVDGSTQKRTLLSARFEYRVRDESTVWADVWHQDYDATGLQSYINLGTGLSVPSASDFDATRQYGQDWTYNRARKTVAGSGFDARLNDVFTLRAGYRYGTMWREYAYTGATLTNAAGAYREQYTISPRQNETTHSAYALVDAEFDTFGLGHKVTAGYNGTSYRYDRGDDITRTLGTTGIHAPAFFADPALAVGPTTTWQANHLDNFLLGDRIDLTGRVSVLAGVTHATIKQTAAGSGLVISNSNYRKSALTPSVAVMARPLAGMTVYASYMEALVAGESSSAATTVNRYQVLDPSISKQYEAGVKATWGGVDVNAALFRIDKVNAEVDPRDNVFKQDGRQIHQGLEVTFSGKPLDRLTLTGGFTVMDAHVENALANPATEGKIPVNVPEKQARLYGEYALPFVRDVTVTGGVNYFGRRPVNVLNTDYIGSAATADAGLRYEPEVHGHRIAATLTVSNIFDRHYWAYYRSGDGLLLGGPRLVSVSLKATW